MNPPFELRELRYFVAVAEKGQLTKAADDLHVAQPAVSQCLAKLECRLGIRLLERHARGVSLTPPGEVFFAKARAALDASAEALSCVEPWVRGEGRIALGFTPSAQGLARPLRRRFMERYPGVEIEISYLDVAERVVALGAGRVDVELLYPAPESPALVTQTLLESPRYVVLSEHHRLASREQLVLADIAGETFQGPQASRPEEWSREASLVGDRGEDPPVSFETPVGLDRLWALIYAGETVAVLPRFMLSAAVGDGVRAIPLIDVPPLEVVLARRRGDQRRAVLALFELSREAAEADADRFRGQPIAA